MPITLENTSLRLVVAPEVGGAVVRFDSLGKNGPEPIFRPGSHDERDPNRLGLYPLLPWVNRIGTGGFVWQGEHYRLAANQPGEPLPLHGDGWQQTWRVRQQNSSQVSLELESSHQPPFLYHASLVYRIVGAVLTVELAVTHQGDLPAPYGMGLHPWLPRTPDVEVEAPAQGVWEMDAQQLPAHWHSVEERPEWDFRQARTLPDGVIDNPFTGWNGHARLAWPSRGMTLYIDSDPPCPRYQVFSPGREADIFCFEPVTHDVNAHHLEAPLEHGLIELARGQTLRARYRFQVTRNVA
ncbi:aldose 1-epimerase [Halomonas sp. WWR20]